MQLAFEIEDRVLIAHRGKEGSKGSPADPKDRAEGEVVGIEVRKGQPTKFIVNYHRPSIGKHAEEAFDAALLEKVAK